MRQPKDGDVLMLTRGPLAGNLVRVDFVDGTDGERVQPFFCDEYSYRVFRNSPEDAACLIISAHDLSTDGEFPFHFEIIGRWK